MASRFRLFSRMFTSVKEVESLSRSAIRREERKLDREIRDLRRKLNAPDDDNVTILVYGVGFGVPLAMYYNKFGDGWCDKAKKRWLALESNNVKQMREENLRNQRQLQLRYGHCRTCSCSLEGERL